MTFMWATRGRTWGFRFLRTAGVEAPLSTYERAFAGYEDAPTVCHGKDGVVAVRFPDPEGRRDHAGRIIPHDFVVFAREAERIHSVEMARELLWPQVADTFAETWDRDTPPQAR
jgi:hypothetical protein